MLVNSHIYRCSSIVESNLTTGQMKAILKDIVEESPEDVCRFNASVSTRLADICDLIISRAGAKPTTSVVGGCHPVSSSPPNSTHRSGPLRVAHTGEVF
jgi:hypothetical protein